MPTRLLVRLREWAGVLALILVLTGGVAYAANTVFSSDIVDNQVRSVDVRDDTLAGGGLAAADLRSGSVGPAEAGGLTGADIANVPSGSDNVNANKLDGIDSSGLVQGRGKVLANRFILVDVTSKTLLEIPGFGRFDATCTGLFGEIIFTNTTNFDVEFWGPDGAGDPSHRIVKPFGTAAVAVSGGQPAEATTVALGFGDDPGARRTATVHAFVAEEEMNDPCFFQAQGMLWTGGTNE